MPEVREVGSEAAEALRREREVVRLGDREQRHRCQLSSAREDVEEVVERLERHTLGLEVLGQPGPREDPFRGQGGAAVGVAVADVDERLRREPGALAPVTAPVARPLAAPEDAPPVGPRVDSVGEQLDLDALAGEQRPDQLLEAARQDERVVAPHELVEAGPELGVLGQPGVDVLEPRVCDRRELDLHQPRAGPSRRRRAARSRGGRRPRRRTRRARARACRRP